MGGGNDLVEREPERWDVPCPELNLAQLDRLEGDGVNIQCINSSEFVVGKQTNFNAPVTIINCDGALDLRQPLDNLREEGREKIVIRGKVLSKSAAMTVQKVAGQSEKADTTGNSSTGKSERWGCSRRKPWGKVCLVATIVFLIFLVTTVIPLGILLPPMENADKSDKSETPAGCIRIPRKGGDICLFSTPALAAWDTPKDLTPMELPVPFVVVAQTHGGECYFVQQCFKVLEDFRLEEKNTTWCNFFVGGDGNVYEGLGWETKNSIGGPAEGKNVRLCFMGEFFELDFPTYPQVEGIKALIEYGVRIDRISKNYTLMASNAINPTDHLFEIYNIIKKWPNFKKNPFESVIVPFDFVVDESPQEPRHKIYSKSEWRGLPPTSSVEMKLPVPYAVISHSVTPQCFDLDSCSPLIRNMQKDHLSRLYADIAYNFLVDSGGNIYEGRGWTKRNIKGGMYNGRNININLIGDFSLDVAPAPEQLNATKFLLEKGVQEGNLAQNYLLISDNSTHATFSPGKNVYAEIKCWPHFVNDPKQHEKQFHER